MDTNQIVPNDGFKIQLIRWAREVTCVEVSYRYPYVFTIWKLDIHWYIQLNIRNYLHFQSHTNIQCKGDAQDTLMAPGYRDSYREKFESIPRFLRHFDRAQERLDSPKSKKKRDKQNCIELYAAALKVQIKCYYVITICYQIYLQVNKNNWTTNWVCKWCFGVRIVATGWFVSRLIRDSGEVLQV